MLVGMRWVKARAEGMERIAVPHCTRCENNPVWLMLSLPSALGELCVVSSRGVKSAQAIGCSLEVAYSSISMRPLGGHTHR